MRKTGQCFEDEEGAMGQGMALHLEFGREQDVNPALGPPEKNLHLLTPSL